MSTNFDLFERSRRYIPGGVNSPVRAFSQVGGTPRFIDRGDGPFIYDVEDVRYIDLIGSWGPMILGHASTIQLNALQEVLKKGTSFGAPTEIECEFAEILCQHIPCLEMVRLVSSGTEATMSAIRLARAFTAKPNIIKFDGCYHGHGDSFLVSAGSGLATQGISHSPGVLPDLLKHTFSIPFNSKAILEEVVASRDKSTIAALIVEPVPGNMGLVLPEPGYLEFLREFCTANEILLIFDEVMSGFRVDLRGAVGCYGVNPDLICFGKVIGGGLPIGAFGGREDIMSRLAPLGPVYQAGTLSGNPLAVASGLATLSYLIENNPYSYLEGNAQRLSEGLREAASRNGIPLQVSYLGSMFGFFFSENPVQNFQDAKNCNIELFNRFFHGMLEEGVYFAPSAFEAGFLSICHNDEIISEILTKADLVFAKISGAN